MASTESPYGFRPIKMLGAAYNTAGSNQYPIADAYATKLHYGDPVGMSAAGDVVKAAAADGMLGIFVGCEYDDPVLNYRLHSQWYPTGVSNITAFVVDDPDAIFQCQADGSLANSATMSNASLVVGTGNDAVGNSTSQVNATDADPTATTLDFKIVKVADPGSAFTDVWVKFNANHLLIRAAGKARS